MMKPINSSDAAKVLALLLRSGVVKEARVLDCLERVCRGRDAAMVDAALEIGLFYCDATGGFLSAHKFIETMKGRSVLSANDIWRLPYARWYADRYDV